LTNIRCGGLFSPKLKAAANPPGKGFQMKLELVVNGVALVIESDSAIKVQIMEKVAAVAAPVAPPAAVAPVAVAPVAVPAPAAPAADGLFARLSGLRRELAAASGVPPYVIFQDKTLHEMVAKMPADLAAFGAISGVGAARLEKYGARFLAVIRGAA
jgi:ATP-dependent DNA helicase RecQ